MSTEFNKTRRLKSAQKGGLTRIFKDLDVFLSTASENAIVSKKATIERALLNITSLSEKLYSLIEDEDSLDAEVANDLAYDEQIQCILVKLEQGRQVISRANLGIQKSTVKLPALTLPRFGGDPAVWTGFWDLFNCSVHGRSDLSDIQKFTYLRTTAGGRLCSS